MRFQTHSWGHLVASAEKLGYWGNTSSRRRCNCMPNLVKIFCILKKLFWNFFQGHSFQFSDGNMLSSQQEFNGTRFALLFAIVKHIRTCRTSGVCLVYKRIIWCKKTHWVCSCFLFIAHKLSITWCEPKWWGDFFQLRKLPVTQWILFLWAVFKLRIDATKINSVVQVGLYAQHIQT